MMISTRGRYAIRVLLDIAVNGSDDGYIPMKEVAARQGISLKYLEKIMPILVKAGMVEGVHGKNGGYKLTRRPAEYRIGDVIRLTEGDLAPVACLECDTAVDCARADNCLTITMWKKLDRLINGFFDGITLEDLLKGNI